jgi:hypothetical protein
MEIPTEDIARFVMEKAMARPKKIKRRELEKEKLYFVIPPLDARYIGKMADEENKMTRIWQYAWGDFEKVNDKVPIQESAAIYEIPANILKISPPGFTSYDTSQNNLRKVPKFNLGDSALKNQIKTVNYNESSNEENNKNGRTATFRNNKKRKNRKQRKTRRYQRR